MKKIADPRGAILRPFSIERYMKVLGVRKTNKKWQPTRHQQDAADTAELFDDVKSIGIYLKIFKKYKRFRPALIKCRQWVFKHGGLDKGRLFVAVYQKFLNLEEDSKKIGPKEKKQTKKEKLVELLKKNKIS